MGAFEEEENAFPDHFRRPNGGPLSIYTSLSAIFDHFLTVDSRNVRMSRSFGMRYPCLRNPRHVTIVSDANQGAHLRE